MPAASPYEILGDEGIGQLCRVFYEVMDELPQAAELRALHAADLSEVQRKLAAYLTGWMGGPPVYLAAYGTVCLTDAHKPFLIDERLRDQWLLCMDEALHRTQAGAELKTMLAEPLRAIADAVVNYRGGRQPTGARVIARG